ncbi:hypothetical protein HG531_006460 [Fusarium graminearum]|nr:hypothetical protein HG531_006460 [Fusarium graminearum]
MQESSDIVLGVFLEHLDGVRVVKLRGSGVGREIVDTEVVQWHQSMLLLILGLSTGCDVVLQLVLPLSVIDLGGLVTIVLKTGQVFVHSQTRVTSDVSNVNTVRQGVKRTSHDNVGDVVHGYSVDCVDDVRPNAKLNTALEHSDQEIVSVADTSLNIT